MLAEYTSNRPYLAPEVNARRRDAPSTPQTEPGYPWTRPPREGLVYLTYTRQDLGGTYALSGLAATGITAWGHLFLNLWTRKLHHTFI